MNAYSERKAALEKSKCRKCSGLGTLNDADIGDTYYNEWKCPDCKGTGLAPQPSERRS